ncbi:hypothetical protein BKA64DRAFT_673198 [Cadophora sp. MPI-SDFR-AT-0126]|nr:hypothetical protein BKA64DRAFT_673198 [Leotiomycetes sp. MPI-SDFR-AT-0126]
MARIIALVAVLTHSLVSATTTFSPNCTLPNVSTSFVASPNTRGTLDILWSGLFTIFICIWTVQHLNVPEQRDGRDPGWQGDVKWAWKAFWTKFKWMLYTLILPEVLLGKALADRDSAKQAVFFSKTLEVTNGTPLSDEEESNWTLTHAYYANMGGFAFRTSTPRPNRKGYQLQHITADDLLRLRAEGNMARLPDITEHEIKDKSKGDFIVKATAVIQVSWLVIQVIVRATRSLPVSQLEITACAFAACTFLTYGIWWSKPQAVTSCTMIELEGTNIEAEATIRNGWKHADSTIWYLWPWVKKYHSGPRRRDMPIRNDFLLADADYGLYLIGLTTGCIILGAVHCGAWHLHFPTRAELLIWRYISVASCAILPVTFGHLLIVDTCSKRGSDQYWLHAYLHVGMIVLYIGCRLYLLFESIYSLLYLPPGAYITTWASNIPHIG